MKKSQGEIFGIALFFVVLIVGIIIYANIKSLEPDFQEESFESKQYEILSADALNSLKKMSTGCGVERDKDALEDMIRYCFDYARNKEDSPRIECGGVEIRACERSLEILNDSLQHLFNENSSEALVASIPFSLEISNPDFEHEVWHNVTLTNVEDFGLSLDRNNESFYLKKRFKRQNAGFDIITTGRRNVELAFNIYYR